MAQTDKNSNKRKTTGTKTSSGTKTSKSAPKGTANGRSSGASKGTSKSAAGSRSKSGSSRSSASTRSNTSSKARGNQANDRGGDPSMLRHQLAPYIFGLAALFLVICYLVSDSTGFVGGALKKLLFGLFSSAAWAVPFLLVNIGIFWKRDIASGSVRYKLAFTSAVMVLISVLINAFSRQEQTFKLARLWELGIEGKGGGVIGGLIGNLLLRGFGFAGTLILTIALILLFGIFLFGMTPHMFMVYIATGLREWRSGFKDQMEVSRIQREQLQIEYDQRRIAERQAALRLREQQLRSRQNAQMQTEIRRRPTVNDAMSEDFEPAEPIISEPSYSEPIMKPARSKKSEAVDLDAMAQEARSKRFETEEVSDEVIESEQSAAESIIAEPSVSEPIGDFEPIETEDEVDQTIVESDAPPFAVEHRGEADEEEDEVAEPIKSEPKLSFFRKEKVRNVEEKHEDEAIDLSKIFTEPEDEVSEVIEPIKAAESDEDESENDIPTSAEIDLVIEKSRLCPEPMPEPVLEDEDEDADEAEENDEPPFEVEKPKPTVEAVKPEATEEYRFPPAALLAYDPSPRAADKSGEIQQTAMKLVETLRSFNVKTKIINVSCGPTVTRYELQPEVGTKVRSILNLVDDIALHLATSGVRIEAPIPGKEAVGIEVPNKTQSTVYIRELIENDGFKNSASKATTCLGEDVGGNPVYLDIAKMPHLLIAGTTGSGKSVCINSLIISILYKARPDEVKFILIDPKKVELNPYNGIPHLLVPVVSDPKKAAGSLHWAVTEMERRYELIEGANVRNLKGYNKSIENDPTAEKLPLIVIVIDELADLMMMAKDDVEDSIIRIAQKARAAGIHLIIGTQRPSVDVITGLIKANVPSRIAFTTMSQIDSRTIIDTVGAEKLIGRGDMLYAPIGSMKPTRVQGSFVSDDEVEAITEFIKNNCGKRDYDQNVMESIEREAQLCGNKKSTVLGDGDEEANDGDPMLKPAIQLAVESGKISTSLIQRRLQLGYGRAAKLIDTMQDMGIVGPPQGQKPREVLISKQEYMEMELRREE